MVHTGLRRWLGILWLVGVAACGDSNATPDGGLPPTLTLTADPTMVASGGESTLTWSTTDATSCEASGAWSGSQPTSGSVASGPLTATSTFTLSCSGPGGTAVAEVLVSVAGAVCGPGSSTVLGQLVADVAPRTWVKMAPNPSLAALTLDYSLAYWADSGVWDPVRHVARWVGGPGSCCADPAKYKMLTYDPAQDTWAVADTPLSGSGHGYDGNAVDRATGDHYFTRFQDEIVRRWDGATWSNLPALPFSVGAAQGLTWFPSLQGGAGGLVFVYANGQATWFDGTKWNPIAGGQAAPWGAYHIFAEYNPVLDVVWLGGGNNAERVHYRLDSSLNLQRMADAPFNLRMSDSFQAYDPVSGTFIVTKRADSSFWEYDMAQDQWSQITDATGPAPTFGNGGFQISIPECGVIMYVVHNNTSRSVYVYRP